MRRFRGCQPSWYLLKTLYKYLRKPWPKQAWIPVVSWSLYFWKRVFRFRADSILKSDGDFISNWKFPDCVRFFSAWARQAVIQTIAVVYEHTKRTQEICSPIGHNNTKHFLCPIRSRHPLEFFGNGPVRVGTQGLFRPSLKTFVSPFLPRERPVPELPACRRLYWHGHTIKKKKETPAFWESRC